MAINLKTMQRFNKAYAGGAGAAVAVIVVWLVETLGQVVVPGEVEGALAIIFAALGPAIGPGNK